MSRFLNTLALPLLLLGTLLAPARAGAQQRTPSPFASAALSPVIAPAYSPLAADSMEGAAPALLVLGGAAGGAVGLVGGAYVGYFLAAGPNGCGDPGNPDDWCGFGGALLGAVVGEVSMIPLGVHLANGRRGSYGPALLASTGVFAGGILLAAAVRDESGILFWSIPAGQIAASMYVERATARKRQRARAGDR